MSKIELHYSIKDGGDGSAYPVWFETKELAEWHQDNLDIGWGESCTGKIVVEGDNLKCIQLQTAVSHFAEMLGDYHFELEKAIDFVWIFLPDTQMDDWSVSCDMLCIKVNVWLSIFLLM